MDNLPDDLAEFSEMEQEHVRLSGRVWSVYKVIDGVKCYGNVVADDEFEAETAAFNEGCELDGRIGGDFLS